MDGAKFNSHDKWKWPLQEKFWHLCDKVEAASNPKIKHCMQSLYGGTSYTSESLNFLEKKKKSGDEAKVDQCPFKGTIGSYSVILNSQLHFFSNPQIFLHIQRELHCNKLPRYNNSLRSSMFLERETIICSWEIIFAGKN